MKFSPIGFSAVFYSGTGRAHYRRVILPVYKALPFLLIFSLSSFFPVPVTGQTPASLPLISRLDSRDISFKQFLLDVEDSRRLLFRGGSTAEQLASTLTIYTYIPGDNDELLSIAARCSIPYDTLVSLNRISHADELVNGKSIILPSIPGIFIPLEPGTDLERLLISARAAEEQNGVILAIPREGKMERFRFIPGDEFTATERIFFLNRGFHYPLQHFEVSSFYGPRSNPVTGKFSMHAGVDLAAPLGAEVYAVRNGTVMDLGEDQVLGKYIILSHENNWISLYGHLSSILTSLHAELQSGNLIGRVGTSGQSTGPHLHFELRQNGQSRDPARLLGIFRSTAR